MIPIVHLEGIAKTYRVGPLTVNALSDVSLQVWPGDFVAISGPSGSGKSTLLNILGLLDRPDAGAYELDGRAVASATDDELTLMRNRKLGFVFQASPMLPRLTVEQNVALPLVYRGVKPREAGAEAHRMLVRVGLGPFARQPPADLSGGQLQRAAIARALVGQPKLILADEPTAALDARTAEEIMTLLLQFNRDAGAALVVITHDPGISARARHAFVLEAGRLQPALQAASR